jgi:SNF2 family DNA or RNA helicase
MIMSDIDVVRHTFKGKTVQIVAFIGNIVKNWDAFPVLIVVPTSTVTIG